MSRPLISAVVVTRDRPELVERCVDSILRNDYRPLEIVILDNGSPDSQRRLAAWIEALGDDVPVHHHLSPPIGFGALRREAMLAAHGDLLWSIDDDCIAAADAADRIAAHFEQDDTLGLLGGNLINIGFDGLDRFKGRGRLGPNGRYEVVTDARRAEVFGSANQTVLRRAYELAGGFDPFFRDGMEEADLALSIRRAGFRSAYAEDVRIEHHHSPSRFRRRGANLEAMRLYLYCKHFPPRSLRSWCSFLAREVTLLAGDLWRTWGQLPKRYRLLHGAAPSRILRAFGLTVLESVKSCGARLALPWLYGRARASQRVAARSAGREVAA